jgi:hypothetical protein
MKSRNAGSNVLRLKRSADFGGVTAGTETERATGRYALDPALAHLQNSLSATALPAEPDRQAAD